MNPLVANRYVPRSVASEHLTGASGAAEASAASALPTPARANGNDKASAPTWFFMSPPRMLASSPKKNKETYDGKSREGQPFSGSIGDEDRGASVARFDIARSDL